GGAAGQADEEPVPLPRLQHAGLEPEGDLAPDLGAAAALVQVLGDSEEPERDRGGALGRARCRRARHPARPVRHGAHQGARASLDARLRPRSRLRLMPAVAAPEKQSVAVPATPYVGLTPFTESDAPFFFGREKERRIIAANLLASRLTLLYGASGVGKSSIIRAGLQRDFRTRAEEALAAGRFPESIVVVFTGWRDDPIAGLVETIDTCVHELLGKLAPRPPRKTLRLDELLVEWNRRLDEKALQHAGADADLDEPNRTELLIVLDQFEQ